MRGRWLDGVAVVLLVAALAVRLVRLDAFIAADELRWVCRSLSFGQALASGDFKNTFQTGHPGVVTMWLGTLAISPLNAPAAVLDTCRITENAQSPSAANAAQLAGLADTLWQMRVAASVFNSLLLVVSYGLTRRLVGPWLALGGLTLLAFDPFLLAHSRVLHLDAVLSGLMLVSALLLLQAFSPRRTSLSSILYPLSFSGLIAGIALTQKVAAVFLWPWVGLMLLALAWRSAGSPTMGWGRGFSRSAVGILPDTPTTVSPRRVSAAPLASILAPLVRLSLAWGLSLILGIGLVWPAMWVNPVGTIQGVITKAEEEGGNPHQAGQVIGEEIVDDPGPLMYVLALGFRASPWMLVGLVAGGWWLVIRRRDPTPNPSPKKGGGSEMYMPPSRMGGHSSGEVISPSLPPSLVGKGVRGLGSASSSSTPLPMWDYEVWRSLRGTGGEGLRLLLALLAFALLFGLLIALSPKKFDRYLLPAFPPLDLVAGISLAALADRLRLTSYALRFRRVAALAVLLGTQLLMVLPHAPYYLTYYNPALGGGSVAARWLLIGWGEGYDLAAAYLNQLPNAPDTQAAVRGVSQFAPIFVGETRSAPGYRAYQTDYVVLYSNEIQRRRNEGLIQRFYENPAEKPVYVVRLHGLDYAWIYANTTATQALTDLAPRTQPGDTVMVNGDSLAAKGLPVGLNQAKVYGHFGPIETAEALAAVPPGARLWYVRYTDADPGVILDALREHAILEGEPRRYPELEVWAGRMRPSATMRLQLAVESLQIVGWGTSAQYPVPGKPEGLTLAWQVNRPISEDLSLVLEMVDTSDVVVTRTEKTLRAPDMRPTSQWTVGERVETLLPFTVPLGTPPGGLIPRLRVRRGEQWLAVGGRDAVRLDPLTINRSAPITPPAIPTRVDVNLGQGLRLLGHTLTPMLVQPGQTLDIPLWWQVTGSVSPVNLQLAARDATGRLSNSPPRTLISPEQSNADWRAGDVYRVIGQVAVSQTAPRGPASIELTLRRLDGQPAATLTLGQVWVNGPALTELPQPPQWPTDYRLGDGARLMGYATQQTAPGHPLTVTFYWRAGVTIPTAYSVFVHLLRPDGSILTQADRAPGLGLYPTNTWQANEVVIDPYTFDLPPNTPPGRYQVAVGWYTPQGRAPARDAQDQPVPDDRIVLEIELK